jgi:hypothetical protein
MALTFLIIIVFVTVFLYPMCVVSSRCSREEERIAESIEKARVKDE